VIWSLQAILEELSMLKNARMTAKGTGVNLSFREGTRQEDIVRAVGWGLNDFYTFYLDELVRQAHDVQSLAQGLKDFRLEIASYDDFRTGGRRDIPRWSNRLRGVYDLGQTEWGHGAYTEQVLGFINLFPPQHDPAYALVFNIRDPKTLGRKFAPHTAESMQHANAFHEYIYNMMRPEDQKSHYLYLVELLMENPNYLLPSYAFGERAKLLRFLQKNGNPGIRKSIRFPLILMGVGKQMLEQQDASTYEGSDSNWNAEQRAEWLYNHVTAPDKIYVTHRLTGIRDNSVRVIAYIAHSENFETLGILRQKLAATDRQIIEEKLAFNLD
jgi:hypothetical protein